MCEFDKKSGDTRIDPCMREAIKTLNLFGIKTLACCCGHGKYPMSIIIGPAPFELFTGVPIERKKRFYKRDKQGYYFIPEAIEEYNKKKV